MKVKKTIAESNKTASSIDLFSDLPFDLSKAKKREIAEEVGDFLVEQILDNLSSAKSPVQGETFPVLSKKYKSKKIDDVGTSKPDLNLTGSMYDAISYSVTKDGIDLGVFGKKDAPKADNHNKFSAESLDTPVPQRRFLPDEGQTFKPEIQNEIAKIIQDKIAEDIEFKKSELNKINTKSDFHKYLTDKFQDFDAEDIADIISRNPDMAAQFKEQGFLKWLKGL